MHTPGPWKTAGRGDKMKQLPIYANGKIIAAVRDYGSLSDARLIAAAPDLLLALETCLKNTEMRRASGFESGPMIDYEIEIARAAIAKATGKTD